MEIGDSVRLLQNVEVYNSELRVQIWLNSGDTYKIKRVQGKYVYLKDHEFEYRVDKSILKLIPKEKQL